MTSHPVLAVGHRGAERAPEGFSKLLFPASLWYLLLDAEMIIAEIQISIQRLKQPEGRPCGLAMRLALMRVPAGEEVEALAADVAAERLVALLLAVLVLPPHVGREGEDGRKNNRADLSKG